MKLTKKQRNFPFLIVSGHRRSKSAVEIKLPAVPIQVRVYANETEHKEDRLVLNVRHLDLAPIEQARQLKQLVDSGLPLTKAAKVMGDGYPLARKRMDLVKLDSGIQELLASNIKGPSRIPLGIAEALGRIDSPTVNELLEKHEDDCPDDLEELNGNGRRFLLQRILLKHVQDRKLNSRLAIAYIEGKRQELLSYHSSGRSDKRAEKFEPKNRLKIFSAWIKSILETIVRNWSKEEFNRIFKNSSHGDVGGFIKSLRKIQKLVGSTITTLEKIQNGKKPSYVDEHMVCVDYYDFGVLLENQRVTHRKFVNLWESGALRFQVEKSKKPPELPTCSEAKKKTEEDGASALSSFV